MAFPKQAKCSWVAGSRRPRWRRKHGGLHAEELLPRRRALITSGGGTLALVNFFAPWCTPCHRGVPVMNALARAIRHTPVVLAVRFNPGGASVLWPFIGKLGVSSMICQEPAGDVESDGRPASEAPFGAAKRAASYIVGELDWLSAEPTRFIDFFRRQEALRD